MIDRRLVIYALDTPRATKESISGRFFINDLTINNYSLRNNKAIVANEA